MANPTIAVVAAALCIALASAWTALLRNSPIDPANIDLPHPPQRLGVFAHNKRLQNPHKFGSGSIPNPEDLVFDSQGRLYTGCGDGWIKRISFLDNLDVLVENWTYVGGRPLGLAFGIYGELLVCEPSQGLLNVTEGHVDILTNEADGLEFKFADGVDVSIEGAVYFTDVSYKYGFHDHLLDLFELRPHGRLLKYEASTNTTSVLLTDLYFPNGVVLSAKQDFLVFCETSLYRCQKYWLKGPEKGTVESFIDNLPGLPDNVHYDGNGTFWIGVPTGLLNVTEGHVDILTNEAHGLEFKFADGVDVSIEGAVYFTDASYKYGFHDHLLDLFEFRPHGRLLKYEASTKTTSVLLKDLYFPNGVALSAKQDFLVFCETSLYRCQKYWLKGPEKGTVESFIDNLPGLPDNIHYDGNGTFWIGVPTSRTLIWRIATKFPSVRHVLAVMTTLAPRVVFDAIINEPGVLAVNEMGNPIALYSDPNSKNQINTGLKRGDSLYSASLTLDYIGRVTLMQEIPIN